MLSGLVLENFLAFKERQVIPFAPITLVFGVNSSGKSTIMRALRKIQDAVVDTRAENGKIIKIHQADEIPYDKKFRDPVEVGLWWNVDGASGNKFLSHLAQEPHVTGVGIGNRQAVQSTNNKKLIYSVTDHPVQVSEAADTFTTYARDVSDLLVGSFAQMVYIPAIRGHIPHQLGPELRENWNDYPVLYRVVQDDDYVVKLNAYMNEFGGGYNLYHQPFRSDRSVFGSRITIIDPRISEMPRTNEVGSGTKSLIDMLTHIVPNANTTILIEEPETHMHPKMQAEMGSMFAKMMNEDSNQFIIETHSEHLIRRLQKLIRRGAQNPDDEKRLTHEDVCILYVWRDQDGSHVKQMELDERGSFKEPWPDDFFDIIFNDAFEGYFETLPVKDV